MSVQSKDGTGSKAFSQCPSLLTIVCWLKMNQTKWPENKICLNQDLCLLSTEGWIPTFNNFTKKNASVTFYSFTCLKTNGECIFLISFIVVTPWQMLKLNSWYTFQIFIALQHAQPVSNVSDRLHPAVMCMPLKNSLSCLEFMLVRAN